MLHSQSDYIHLLGSDHISTFFVNILYLFSHTTIGLLIHFETFIEKGLKLDIKHTLGTYTSLVVADNPGHAFYANKQLYFMHEKAVYCKKVKHHIASIDPC